jgi:nucleolin
MRRAGTRGAAVVPRGKAGNKRLAAGEIKEAVSAKKQKAAPPAKGKAGNQGQKQPPPKEESSSPEEREHLPDSLSEEVSTPSMFPTFLFCFRSC